MQPPALLAAIDELISSAIAFETANAELLASLDPTWNASARNLLHYLSLRQRDLRELQLALSQSGLSSLGRSEGAVLSTLEEVRARLACTVAASGEAPPAHEPSPTITRWTDAENLLHAHTRALFGTRPTGRHVYIMATAPSAREADGAWMDAMLSAGMDVLRINTAHEGPAEWARLRATLRAASDRAGKSCRVLVDLPGPKLRTGPMEPGPDVMVLKPTRDAFGRTTAPLRVTIAPKSWRKTTSTSAGPTLFVDDDWFAKMRAGDEIDVTDARDRKRALTVRAVDEDHASAECERSIYLQSDSPIALRRKKRTLRKGTIGAIPATRARIEVSAGDPLILRADGALGRPAARSATGAVLRPASISCEVPEALSNIKVGDRVLIDDGKIETVVEAVALPEVSLRVQRAGRGVAKIEAEKGINLPDTAMDIANFGPDDRVGLEFALANADMIGLSFLRRAEDLDPYLDALSTATRTLGVVLKIETRQAFDALPSLLLRAMRRYPVGVMIARGDLAVECGFERLAEIQEEILWISEAAHVPAIWATQVLDGLAQTGVPSRAEVTDASMAVRAECVMLNKGPFIARAVRVLDDILRRMERHTYKKRQLFRRLEVSASLGQREG
ncbi:MAG: pyruvate kinase [Polyangiales bacterium]